MLYATTRSDKDIYTAQKALTELRSPDGGYYVPYREPALHDLDSLLEKSQQEILAEVLNRLFKTRLTPWDLTFTAGRNPLRVSPLGRRTVAGERFYNTGGEFSALVKSISDRIAGPVEAITPAAELGVGIASLVCLYALAKKQDPEVGTLDLALSSGNMLAAAGAWFLRSWGLPIGKIICSCSESSGLWELLHSGSFRTGAVGEAGLIPGGELILPPGLELLLYACGGRGEAKRYAEACRTGSTYFPGEGTLRKLREGMAVRVISEKRILELIPGAWATHHYILSPGSALAYGGLLDYRAAEGTGNRAMVLADRSPRLDAEPVAKALGTEPDKIR